MIRTQKIVGVSPEAEIARYTPSLVTPPKTIFGFHAFEAILTYLTGTESRFYQLVAPTLSACRDADPAEVLRVLRTALFLGRFEQVHAQHSSISATETVHEVELMFGFRAALWAAGTVPEAWEQLRNSMLGGFSGSGDHSGPISGYF